MKSSYCHHRAMRELWRGFDEVEKNQIVQDKNSVHKLYSTSFGLHVAVLTNEGKGKRKFVFTQRSRRAGRQLLINRNSEMFRVVSVKKSKKNYGEIVQHGSHNYLCKKAVWQCSIFPAIVLDFTLMFEPRNFGLSFERLWEDIMVFHVNIMVALFIYRVSQKLRIMQNFKTNIYLIITTAQKVIFEYGPTLS